MNLENNAEQILLESDDDLIAGPTEESFSKVSAHLVQIQKWKHHSLGTQILDNKFLFVKRFQNGKNIKYWANLLFADPIPKRERHIDWRWGLGALILLANSAGLMAAEHYFHVSAHFIYFNSITVVALALALISVLVMIYRYRNSLVFTTAHGKVPILTLAMNNPSKAEFQNYAKTLRECIERLQQQHAHRMNNQLANELAEHRRLKDSEAISAQEYENAKNRILSRH